ncbi:MAG TPA: translation elongation factor Ts [Kiritimatiellia bacterium]|nr:translation elongation factor Ts [Kiritimatiellia bacterium]HRZ12710.1 translation elongation factor Ts [Kiritimatiellia bacterium]HSA18338.1 translation elongation factor Ts [Kiritimatiellia bacterium]
MVEISATLVKELREETNVGMMECKKALVEAGGNKQEAIRILRERGLAIAGKKASRTAKEGQIASEIRQGGKLGAMVEVNCETDFVARNESFQAFLRSVAEKALMVQGDLAEAMKDILTAKITEIGENMLIRRSVRFEVKQPGIVASYIHLGGKVGVLVEVGCGNEATEKNEAFRELVKDITLHIAACQPHYLARQDVPAEVIKAESDIYAKQVQNKPPQIIQKIVTGKLEKFYDQVCLVEQGFVKDPDISMTDLLAAKGKEIGDTLQIRRFARYQVGEQI